MHKKQLLLLVAFASFITVASSGCDSGISDDTNPGHENVDDNDEPTADELKAVSAEVPVSGNWVFSGKPDFSYTVKNSNDKELNIAFKVVIKTDRNKDVITIEEKKAVKAGSSRISFTTPENLEPGIYRAICYMAGKKVAGFYFAIDPFDIVSAPDKQPDYDEFWASAKAQLEAVDMNPELTLIESRSAYGVNCYLVEMQSVPDGPDGEPVTIRGYYFEPKAEGKYPVLIHFYGYDTEKNPSSLTCPYGSSSPEYAEFYLSHRGQYINNRTANKRTADGKGDFYNIYGDWFAYQFGNKDSYYYRGAFMDCVQAVRFMATRSCCDMNNLFAEGSSQGGALSYAAAALSDYPFTAIAPCVAFLGDFPDYFNIVGWPGNTAKANKGSMTDEEMYAFLSYFDTKNLATRISCAVMACSGLQDGTCPPHTNLAPYNNLLSTDKEYYFYPKMQHEIPSDWSSKYDKFFKARMK